MKQPSPIASAALCGTACALSEPAGSTVVISRLAIAGATLGAAAAIDPTEHRIPNRLVVPAAAACAVFALATGFDAATAVGLGVIALLFAICLTALSTLGMGDIKLTLVVVLGLQQGGLHSLFLALILAGITAVATVISKGREAHRKSLPLAPFLALGALLAVI